MENGKGQIKRNDYGVLCTELYEYLHAEAPREELEFDLSYARKGQPILEPLCGSGRFLVPFLERGFAVQGLDNSPSMLKKLLEKAPDASVVQSGLEEYRTEERFDYIFIPSGSVSLFTDLRQCRAALSRIRGLLRDGGRFVFAVDTTASRCPDREGCGMDAAADLGDGRRLVLRSRRYYDAATQTQFCPSRYEVYRDGVLMQREAMDFQTHLYRRGEMEAILQEIGFSRIRAYASFQKDPAVDTCPEFLYECGV